MSGFITSDGSDFMMSVFAGIEQPPENYWVALVTAPVGTSEAGVELSEPAFEDYSRAQIPVGPENWMVAYGAVTNIVDITFGIPGVSPWINIVGWALVDSETDGRVLYAGDFEPFDVAVGDQVTLSAGSITFSIDLDSWRENT